MFASVNLSLKCLQIKNSPLLLIFCLVYFETRLTHRLTSISTVYFLETSDHSDIESRVRRLRDQLGVRKREVKRLYNERKKQRKAMLRAQEASLRQELQVTLVLMCADPLHVHAFVIDLNAYVHVFV